jgi:hypothetical protein
MKFLVDNQLPLALARFLSANGIESQHVLDIGLDAASDQTIWEGHAIRGASPILFTLGEFPFALSLSKGSGCGAGGSTSSPRTVK